MLPVDKLVHQYPISSPKNISSHIKSFRLIYGIIPSCFTTLSHLASQHYPISYSSITCHITALSHVILRHYHMSYYGVITCHITALSHLTSRQFQNNIPLFFPYIVHNALQWTPVDICTCRSRDYNTLCWHIDIAQNSWHHASRADKDDHRPVQSSHRCTCTDPCVDHTHHCYHIDMNMSMLYHTDHPHNLYNMYIISFWSYICTFVGVQYCTGRSYTVNHSVCKHSKQFKCRCLKKAKSIVCGFTLSILMRSWCPAAVNV